MCEEPYFILECCPNFLGTSWDFEILDLDFISKRARWHSTVNRIALMVINLYHNVYPRCVKNPISNTGVLAKFFGHFLGLKNV